MGWTLPVADAVMTRAMWRRKMLKASGNSLRGRLETAKSADILIDASFGRKAAAMAMPCGG